MSRPRARGVLGSKDGGGQDDGDGVIMTCQCSLFSDQIGLHIARGVQYLNNQGMFHRQKSYTVVAEAEVVPQVVTVMTTLVVTMSKVILPHGDDQCSQKI